MKSKDPGTKTHRADLIIALKSREHIKYFENFLDVKCSYIDEDIEQRLYSATWISPSKGYDEGL